MAPRRAVAGADVDEVGLGIVGDAVPGVAAAAVLPPLAGPGLGRHLHRLRLERLRRIAGHDVEAPRLRAGLGVVGGHVAAHAVNSAPPLPMMTLPLTMRGAPVIAYSTCRSGVVCRTHTTAPGGRVERDEAAVEQADVDPALVERDAAIGRAAITAGRRRRGRPGYARVPPPLQRAGARVEREDHAPGAARVEHAVVDERGRFDLAAAAGDVPRPRALEVLDVLGGDAGEGTEPRLGVVEAVGQPFPGWRLAQPLSGDGGRGP